MEKKKIGLFFGSFNPVHIGHLAIANYFHEFSVAENIWFVVSPHNPLKDNVSLLPDTERLEMVKRAIKDFPGFSVCDVELHFTKPSYTIDTLNYLSENYPEYDFILIIGEDNFVAFEQWKNYREILDNYEIYVYNRSGCTISSFSQHPNVSFFKAPLLDISSTFIREAIRSGKNMRFFLPKPAYEYIEKQKFYREFGI